MTVLFLVRERGGGTTECSGACEEGPEQAQAPGPLPAVLGWSSSRGSSTLGGHGSPRCGAHTAIPRGQDLRGLCFPFKIPWFLESHEVWRDRTPGPKLPRSRSWEENLGKGPHSASQQLGSRGSKAKSMLGPHPGLAGEQQGWRASLQVPFASLSTFSASPGARQQAV